MGLSPRLADLRETASRKVTLTLTLTQFKTRLRMERVLGGQGRRVRLKIYCDYE
jgi:hypothetical protein